MLEIRVLISVVLFAQLPLFVICTNEIKCTGVKATFKEFIADFEYSNISEARPFPLCLKIHPASQIAKELTDFRTIFAYIHTSVNTLPLDEVVVPVEPPSTTTEGRYIKEISLSRINVPDPSVYNLRQWIHIKIVFRKPLLGLILQAVSSPLGLPFGEFFTGFTCVDEDLNVNVPRHSAEKTLPCTYRSKSALRVYSFSNRFNWYTCYTIYMDGQICNSTNQDLYVEKHPHVYYVNAAQAASGFSEVHVNFNWIDVMCHEVTAMQFLLLMVEEFQGDPDYAHLAWSPVFHKERMDSGSGNPSPWFGGWKKGTYCHSAADCDKSTLCRGRSPRREPINLSAENGFQRKILYNSEYDRCVSLDEGVDPVTNECPPGPFYCSENRMNASKENDEKKTPGISKATSTKQYLVEMTKSWASCPFNGTQKNIMMECFKQSLTECKCDLSAALGRSRVTRRLLEENRDGGTTNITDPKMLLLYELEANTISARYKDKYEHGIFMIAAWFVVNAISHFLSRFFKESGGPQKYNGCLGFRCWLLVHITLSFVSILLMWMSLLRPMDTLPCTELNHLHIDECAKHPSSMTKIHSALGYMVVGGAHINFILGWIRPLNKSHRHWICWTHAATGFGLYLLAFLAAISTTTACRHIISLITTMVVVEMIVIVASTYFRLTRDKRFPELPSRKVFPVFEPMHYLKFKWEHLAVLVVHGSFHTGILILIIVTYKAQANDGGQC